LPEASILSSGGKCETVNVGIFVVVNVPDNALIAVIVKPDTFSFASFNCFTAFAVAPSTVLELVSVSFNSTGPRTVVLASGIAAAHADPFQRSNRLFPVLQLIEPVGVPVAPVKFMVASADCMSRMSVSSAEYVLLRAGLLKLIDIIKTS
jgi:hypothetical protein